MNDRDPVRPGRPPRPEELPVSDLAPTSPSAPGVLAAVDGSDGSLWALDRAMTEACLFDLPLYVLTVANPSPGGYGPGMADVVQESVNQLLRTVRDDLRRGVAAVQAARARPYAGRVSLHVVLGSVVETVLAVAGHHHTLVMGARGNGGFTRLLLGSVTTAAVHHAACPVLVVPAPPPGRGAVRGGRG